MSDYFRLLTKSKLFNERWKTWKFQSMTPEFLWHNAAQSHPAQLLWLQYSLDFWSNDVREWKLSMQRTFQHPNHQTSKICSCLPRNPWFMALHVNFVGEKKLHSRPRQIIHIQALGSQCNSISAQKGTWLPLRDTTTSHRNVPWQRFGETWTKPQWRPCLSALGSAHEHQCWSAAVPRRIPVMPDWTSAEIVSCLMSKCFPAHSFFNPRPYSQPHLIFFNPRPYFYNPQPYFSKTQRVEKHNGLENTILAGRSQHVDPESEWWLCLICKLNGQTLVISQPKECGDGDK